MFMGVSLMIRAEAPIVADGGDAGIICDGVVPLLVQCGLNSMLVYAARALPLYVQANGLAMVRL
jgi:hypothetical protein